MKERAEVDAVLADPLITVRQVAHWLIEVRGYPEHGMYYRLLNHYREGHHREGTNKPPRFRQR